jgi:hypothetical protein
MALKKNNKNKKKLFIVAAVVLIAAAGVGTYIWHQDKKSPGVEDATAKTTSNLATAQPNFSSGTTRPSATSDGSQGGATDNNGVIPTNTTVTNNTGSGQPTSSTSGLVTLENPTNGQTINSGTEIYGEAQVGTVQFQLIDNQSGQIASGSLSVVNGKFSGTLQFKSYSSTGKLNVFSQASPTSPEVNLISIPVGLE